MITVVRNFGRQKIREFLYVDKSRTWIFSFPDRLTEDIDVWVHEFTEATIQGILDDWLGYSVSRKFVSLPFSPNFDCRQRVAHYVTAFATTTSHNGKKRSGDWLWNKIMKEKQRRLIEDNF